MASRSDLRARPTVVAAGAVGTLGALLVCIALALLGGAVLHGLVWAFPVRWMNGLFASDVER